MEYLSDIKIDHPFSTTTFLYFLLCALLLVGGVIL